MSAGDGAPPTGGWQFSGRTAMVTGAASGIGRALALALADAGARVALADLQADPLRVLARGRGAIVVTSSHLAYEGAPGATHYAATKGAIESLMRSLACALGPHGIRVNALAPGPSETSDLGPRRAELAVRQPLGRLGTPEEVAAGITYLLSAEADFMTGQVLHVNGGCIMP